MLKISKVRGPWRGQGMWGTQDSGDGGWVICSQGCPALPDAVIHHSAEAGSRAWAPGVVRGAWGTSLGLPSWSLPHTPMAPCLAATHRFSGTPSTMRPPPTMPSLCSSWACTPATCKPCQLCVCAVPVPTLQPALCATMGWGMTKHTSERLARHGVGGQQGHRQGMLC